MRSIKKWLRRALSRPGLRPALAALTLVGCSLAAGAAWGSSGGGHGGGEPHVNWWTWDAHAPPVGWFIVDFVLFLWLIVHYAKKPILQAFAQRHIKIKQAIQDAEKAFSAASERYEDYRGKLANVEEEAALFVDSGRRDGALEKDQIIAAGREYAQRMRSDAESVVSQEYAKARARLRREAAVRVLELTEQTLRRELTEADKNRLVEEAISELESSADAPPRKPGKRGASSRPSAGGAL
jgi:F-type H+-transporting ATPase subunit b